MAEALNSTLPDVQGHGSRARAPCTPQIPSWPNHPRRDVQMGSIDSILTADKELYSLITKEFSNQTSKRYNSDSWTLLQLDEWRSRELPQILKSREHPYLSKKELQLLMDWKLAKGKFRPTLPKLIISNDSESIEEITKAGFKIFRDGVNACNAGDWTALDIVEYQGALKSSLKELCKLRGVGPATASLVLSLLGEISKFAPPFFSDEAFMYYIRDALHPLQPIKYNIKEYVHEYVPVIVGILKKLGPLVTAQILERGAWSLKTYHIYRFDRLADVNLPFDTDEPTLDHFSDTQQILSDVEASTSASKNDEKNSLAPKRPAKDVSSKRRASKKLKLVSLE